MFSQEVLQAIYTWATVALVLIAATVGFAAYRQLRSIRIAREWESAQAIMAELRSPKRISLLRELYSLDREPERFRQHRKIAQFEILISRLQWIGIMVARKQMSFDLVMMLTGAQPLRVWYILGQYIESETTTRGNPPFLQYLVKEAAINYVAAVPRNHWPLLGPPARAETVDLVPCLLREMSLTSSRQFRIAVLKRRAKAVFRKRLRMKKRQWAELNHVEPMVQTQEVPHCV